MMKKQTTGADMAQINFNPIAARQAAREKEARMIRGHVRRYDGYYFTFDPSVSARFPFKVCRCIEADARMNPIQGVAVARACSEKAALLICGTLAVADATYWKGGAGNG